MKKIIALLLVLSTMLVLIACSGEASEGGKSEGTKNASTNDAQVTDGETTALVTETEKDTAAESIAESEAESKKLEEESKKAELIADLTANTVTLTGKLIREDKNGDLKAYAIVAIHHPQGGTFWDSKDKEITVKDPVLEFLNLYGGSYLIPQDYSKCSATVKKLGDKFMETFDAGMYGISGNPTWADLFNDANFELVGGIVYNDVKYLPVSMGVGGGWPTYKYSLDVENGKITLLDNVTGVDLDYSFELSVGADFTSMVATVTFDGHTDEVPLKLYKQQ